MTRTEGNGSSGTQHQVILPFGSVKIEPNLSITHLSRRIIYMSLEVQEINT